MAPCYDSDKFNLRNFISDIYSSISYQVSKKYNDYVERN